MPDTVPVTLELDPETAAALADPATRAHVELLIRRSVRPAGGEPPFKAEAHEAGITDEISNEKLAANNSNNAECRDAPDDLVARFQAFAANHTLGGLAVKDLISEGRR